MQERIIHPSYKLIQYLGAKCQGFWQIALDLIFSIAAKGNGARAGVDTQTGGHNGHDQFSRSMVAAHLLSQRLGITVGGVVQHSQVKFALRIQAAEKVSHQTIDGALAGAGRDAGFDLTGFVIDADLGLDFEQRTKEADCTTYAAAFDQVIHGIQDDDLDHALAGLIGSGNHGGGITAGLAGAGSSQDLPTQTHGV